jgi:hypothetical protein
MKWTKRAGKTSALQSVDLLRITHAVPTLVFLALQNTGKHDLRRISIQLIRLAAGLRLCQVIDTVIRHF